ncbi:molybdenum cofactor guanylyltransferase [Desulfatiferula olefinivorans]
MSKVPCTGVILAGGRNSRMNGDNKAFLTIGGIRIIDRILSVLRPFFDDIVLVTNDPLAYTDLDVRIVTDVIPAGCPLAGLHAGLFHAQNPFAVVLPCDVPFVRPDMIGLLIDHISDRYQVVIPRTAKGLEALFAVYARAALPSIERSLARGQLKIRSFFKPGRVYEVSEKRLRSVDPDLISFTNINRPEELEQALRLNGPDREPS